MTTLKANKDGAVFVSIPEEQGVGETDWIRYKGRYKGAGKVLGVVSGDTTNSQLVVAGTGIVSQGDTIYIQEGVNITVKELNVGVVGEIDATGTLDIFGSLQGALATYEFDGNATDLSGNYNGTWTGTAQYGTGKFGQAALFDGSSHIDSTVQPTPANTTVSLWVNLASVSPTYQAIASCSTNEVVVQGSLLRLISSGATSNAVSQQINLSTGVWYHIVFDGQGNCYVDGVLQTPGIVAGYASADVPLKISGRSNNGDYDLSNGSLVDQVRVFDRILTQSEVDGLYAELIKQIDISSAGLTNAPAKAVLKSPSMSICLETEPRRCISTDYTMAITSAFNDTLVTSLPGPSVFGSLQGALATYEFDGNATDLSGNYNGTWTGTAQYGTGKFGQAALFDGSSHIDSTVQPTPANTTVSLWVNLASVSPTYQAIASCSQIELVANNDLLRLGVGSGWTSQNFNLSTGTWYHIVFDGQGNCYVDGVLQTPGATPSATINLQGLRIGERSIGGDGLAPGSLVDQVIVFDRILTQSNVDTLYTEAPAKDCLDAGDQVQLTVDGSPVTTEVLTIDKTAPGEYTFTFETQPSPPTAAVVPRRDTPLVNPTPVGNWDGDLMELEYDRVTQINNPGRAIQYRIDADDTHQVTQVNIDLGKQE